MLHRTLLSFVFLLCLSSPVLADPAGPMSIVYYEQAPPHSFRDASGSMKGIFIDLLNESLENRMGIQVRHEGYPWSRAQKLVRDGKADAFCTVPNDERRSYTVIASVPTVTAVRIMFAGRTNPRLAEIQTLSRIDQLRNFSVVTYLGSGFAASHPELNCQEVPGSDNAMNMVAANRADIFFELDQHGRYIARQNHLQNSIVEIPMPEEPEVYFHLCIAKTSVYASILPEFDAVMARIHADGTYDTILRRY